MIYDYLDNAVLYEGLSEGIAKGLDILSEMDLESLEIGDHPILGDDIVLKIQSYNTKPACEARLEAHRHYIDIQYIIFGEEKIAVDSLRNAGKKLEAHPENDIWFYEGKGSEILLRAGQFMILYPGETHAPCISVNTSVPVRKALVKVSVDYEV